MGKGPMVFGVKPIRQQYVSPMGACVYTGKSLDQLEYAIRRGHLRYVLARDGSRSFSVDDLDEYMDTGKDKGDLKSSVSDGTGEVQTLSAR